MTNPTDSEIVFSHIRSNPEAFLVALQTRSPETKEAVLSYLQTLPEVGSDKPKKTNPTED